MIKSSIIKWKTRRNIKNRSSEAPISFDKASKVALLYSDDFKDSKGIIKLVDDLKELGLQVNTMTYLKSTKESLDLPFYNEKDILINGKLNKSDLDFFLNPNYDFAICLDNSLSYLLDYIFSIIVCRCRVGIYHPERSSLLDLMIHSDSVGANIEAEILRYLKLVNV